MSGDPGNGCHGKARYRDNVSALLALSRLQRQDKPGHRERRAYRCPVCRGFHLTSQSIGRRAA